VRRLSPGAKTALRSLALLLLGGCLLLAGAALRRDSGAVRIERTEMGTAYFPAEPGASLSPAALLLHSPGDGADTAATELARRGVIALVAGRGTAPEDAWRALLDTNGVRVSAAALLAQGGRCDEALAFLERLAGESRQPAAVILLGNNALPGKAVSSPGRNMLLLTGREAPLEDRAAFLGSREAAERPRGISGYFGQGDARGVEALGGLSPIFARRDALLRLIDWQGSSLGHAITLADDDLLGGSAAFCRAAGYIVILLGLALPPAEHVTRKKQSHNN